MVIIEYCNHYFSVQQANNQEKYHVNYFFLSQKDCIFWLEVWQQRGAQEKRKSRVMSGYLCNTLNWDWLTDLIVTRRNQRHRILSPKHLFFLGNSAENKIIHFSYSTMGWFQKKKYYLFRRCNDLMLTGIVFFWFQWTEWFHTGVATHSI